MKKYYLHYIIGIMVIFFSTPLGYLSINALAGIQGNLAIEFVPLLNGFIASYLIIGMLIFIIGLVNKVKEK